MTTHRFDSDAARIGGTTYPPCSTTGRFPPRVFFEVAPEGGVMTADPPGASIRCEYHDARSGHVRITTDGAGQKRHIAQVMVFAHSKENITEETIAIASAIYWSWWRARDMRGKAPQARDEADQ